LDVAILIKRAIFFPNRQSYVLCSNLTYIGLFTQTNNKVNPATKISNWQIL